MQWWCIRTCCIVCCHALYNKRSFCFQTQLFNEGTTNLGKEFRDELNKYQKAVPPMVTLELLEEEGESVYPSTEGRSATVLLYLLRLNDTVKCKQNYQTTLLNFFYFPLWNLAPLMCMLSRIIMYWEILNQHFRNKWGNTEWSGACSTRGARGPESHRGLAGQTQQHRQTHCLCKITLRCSLSKSEGNWLCVAQHWPQYPITVLQPLTSSLLVTSGTARLPAQQQHGARPDHWITQLSRASSLKTCKNGQHL